MNRPLTLTQNLARSIRTQIEEGAYKPGEKLPSLRTLAELYGYSKNTIVAAFEILVSLGMVEPRRGSGFYVARYLKPAAPADEPKSLDRAMNIVWMMREQFKPIQDAYPIGDGFPPVDWLADLRLDKYHHKVVRGGMGTIFRYGNRYGYLPLREHLVRRLSTFGIDARTNQILMTQGANCAMDLVVRYFVTPGATVLVDDPGYYLLYGKLKLMDATMIGVPRQVDGPDLEALDRLIRQHRPRLFFTQSTGHNPTGSDISAEKAASVLRIAREHNLIVVENDALADYKPLGAPRISALDQLARTIYIGTFSKSLSASLRVGFIACDAGLASELADLKTLVSNNSSEYCERTVDVILQDGQFDKQMLRLRRRLADATRTAGTILSSLGATVFGDPQQSLYLWARLPGVPDTHKLAQDLQEKKILIAPGRLFIVDSDTPCPWSRFNTGALANPVVAEAFRKALA